MNSGVRQPLRFGYVLQQSLRILGDNFVPFYLVGLAVGVPTLVLTVLLPPDAPIFYSNIVETVVSQIATGAITYGSFLYLREQSVGAAACLAFTARNLGRLIGLALVTGLIIVFGFFMLIIPGFIFEAMYAVAVPVLMVERASVSESMRRSTELTKGYRWQVVGLILLPTIGLMVGVSVLESVLVGLELVDYGLGVDDFLIWLLSGLFYVVSAVFAAALYYRLREIKEGLGIDQLAAIFD